MTFVFKGVQIKNNNAAVLMVACAARRFKLESRRTVPRGADALAQGVSSLAWN